MNLIEIPDTETYDRKHPERELWAAVLLQAIEDAVGQARGLAGIYRERAAIEAREWIFDPNDDFPLACAYADLEPEHVRNLVRQKMAEAKAGTLRKDPRGAKPAHLRTNKPRHQLYEHNGRSMTLMQWANEIGIKYNTLYVRVHSGLSLKEAFGLPVRKPGTNAIKQRNRDRKLLQ